MPVLTMADYLLYAAQPSYFSAKVRACFQYKRIPYTELPFNFDRLRDVILPRTGMHLFPVVICPDDTTLQDSCDIVAELERRHPERPVVPADPVQRLLAILFETYADEFLMILGGYYRWVPEGTRAWALRMFAILAGWGAQDKAGAQQVADMTAAEIEGRLPAIGADRPELGAAIESCFERLCRRLEEHFAADEFFLLGARPTLADLGMMNAMFGHLWRDPGPANDFLHTQCIRTGIWIDRLHAAAGESADGEAYVAKTVEPVLAEIGATFGHMAGAILDAADRRLPTQAVGEIAKPGLGRIDTFVVDVPMNRPATTYTAWKLQRLIDAYRAVPDAQRAEADRLLGVAGMLDVCRREPSWRLEKRDFKLHVAAA